MKCDMNEGHGGPHAAGLTMDTWWSDKPPPEGPGVISDEYTRKDRIRAILDAELTAVELAQAAGNVPGILEHLRAAVLATELFGGYRHLANREWMRGLP